MIASGYTFLYPHSRQFPFDDVCEQIVRALEERNWQVPGMKVEFRTYGYRYQMVSKISGDNYHLEFGRPQGRLSRDWNDTAAISEITIPEKQLEVYDDESGPSFHIYVGGNWKRDRERFTTGMKVLSKYYREPRTYLKYKGECRCLAAPTRHTHPGSRPPLLVHDNDLGREYDPRGKEPREFNTTEVMKEFREWIEQNVLASILATPLPEKEEEGTDE